MSYDIVREDIPEFIRRVGDRVIEGSNNSIMIFGTDRSSNGEAKIEDGFGTSKSPNGGKDAGSWHTIVGRSGPNPNFNTDKSYIYMSMKVDSDEASGLENVIEKSSASPAIIMKSDSIRILGRDTLKISVGESTLFMKSDGTLILDGSKIMLGKDAIQKIILGDQFMALFNAHTHNTGVGPSSPPIPQMTPQYLSKIGFIE